MNRAVASASSGTLYDALLDTVRRQRVQMLSRYQSPATKTRCFWTFGRKNRLFLVALRSQRPPWECRMCRPNMVVLLQTSQAPLAMT